MDREIFELNAAEVDWLNSLLAELADRQLDPQDIAGLGAYYDAGYAACQGGAPLPGEEPDAVVNRVGAGLGEHLRSRLPMRWVGVSDQWGTDIALLGQPGETITAPMSMIGKRWNNGVTGFLPELAAAAVDQLSRTLRPAP